MAIYLDALELPDLVKSDEFSETLVESTVVRSLGGALNIWEQAIDGKPLDLVGGSQNAWIAREDLESLYAMASVPGATYALSYEGVTTTVRFRNEAAPVIEATPLVARPNQAAGDWYANVRIKLMEID